MYFSPNVFILKIQSFFLGKSTNSLKVHHVIPFRKTNPHGLVNYEDTKAKLTCKGTLWLVFLEFRDCHVGVFDPAL
jgi:hypothetical protein